MSLTNLDGASHQPPPASPDPSPLPAARYRERRRPPSLHDVPAQRHVPQGLSRRPERIARRGAGRTVAAGPGPPDSAGAPGADPPGAPRPDPGPHAVFARGRRPLLRAAADDRQRLPCPGAPRGRAPHRADQPVAPPAQSDLELPAPRHRRVDGVLQRRAFDRLAHGPRQRRDPRLPRLLRRRRQAIDQPFRVGNASSARDHWTTADACGLHGLSADVRQLFAPETGSGLPLETSWKAEGEGFEPSIRLTADNGFRDRLKNLICRYFGFSSPVGSPASSRRRSARPEGTTSLVMKGSRFESGRRLGKGLQNGHLC